MILGNLSQFNDSTHVATLLAHLAGRSHAAGILNGLLKVPLIFPP